MRMRKNHTLRAIAVTLAHFLHASPRKYRGVPAPEPPWFLRHWYALIVPAVISSGKTSVHTKWYIPSVTKVTTYPCTAITVTPVCKSTLSAFSITFTITVARLRLI